MMGNGRVGIWAVIKVIIMDHHVVITSYFLAYLSLSLLSSANSDFDWFMAFQKQWNETNRDSTVTNSKHVLHTHYSILVDGSFRRMCFVKTKKQTERHVCKHIFLSFGFFFHSIGSEIFPTERTHTKTTRINLYAIYKMDWNWMAICGVQCPL